MKIPQKYCFTQKEAAQHLGLSVDTVKRRVKAGLIPAFRLSERETRILRGDLMEAAGIPGERCFLPDGIAFNRKFLAKIFDCTEVAIQRAQKAETVFQLPEVVFAADIEAFITRYLLFPPEQNLAA